MNDTGNVETLTSQEVADRLGVTRNKVHHLVYAGKLTPVSTGDAPGRQSTFSIDDVKRHKASQRSTNVVGGIMYPNCVACTRECSVRGETIGQCQHFSTLPRRNLSRIVLLYIVEVIDNKLSIREERVRRYAKEWRLLSDDTDRINYASARSPMKMRSVAETLVDAKAGFVYLCKSKIERYNDEISALDNLLDDVYNS